MSQYITKKFEGRNSLLPIRAHNAAIETFNAKVGEKLMLKSGNYYEKKFLWWIGYEDDYVRSRQWLIEKIREDVQWGIRLYEEQSSILDTHIRSLHTTIESIRALVDAEVIDFTRVYIQKSAEATALAYFTDWYAYDAQRWIYEYIPEDILDADQFRFLTSSRTVSFVKEYEYALAQIKMGIAGATKNCRALAQKYRWLRDSYQYVGTLTEEDVARDLSAMTEKQAVDIIDYVENKYTSDNNAKDEMLEALLLNDFQKMLIKLLAYFVGLQDQRKAAIFVTNICATEAYKRILDIKAINNPKDRALVLQAAFPAWILDNDADTLVQLSRKAEEGFLKVAYADVLLGDDAKKTFTKMMNSSTNTSATTKTLNGYVARKGKAVGVARIMNEVDDFEKFREGDILVSSMTRPEMMVIMRKAAAFVTDEGGITCHAAIVSRELGKPCIIGTKVATQVLHDGDLVEVDADNGVVRILERAGG